MSKWFNELLFDGWQHGVQVYTATPGAPDTSTTLALTPPAGASNMFVVGFTLQRAAGTVSEVTFQNASAATDFRDFTFATAAAYQAKDDLENEILNPGAAKVFHSAVGAGGLTLKLSIIYR